MIFVCFCHTILYISRDRTEVVAINQKITRYRFYSEEIDFYLVGNLMNATASSGIIERWDWYLILFVQKLQRFLLVCL